MSIDSCTILNGVSVRTWSHATFTNNTILGSGVFIHVEGDYEIRGNHVYGPAEYGLRAYMDAGGDLDSNTVIGADVGVYVSGGGGWVHDNTITGCSGSGILAEGDPHFWYQITGNLVRECGGYGVAMEYGEARSNTIVACQAGGIAVPRGSGTLWRNVVGRCGGPGIEMTVDPGTHMDYGVYSNTWYLNVGPGFRITALDVGDIANNIAYANQGAGLLWVALGEETPNLACNDWFGNTGGATSGTLPGPTDLAVDPLFCGPNPDDVHLSAGSPLLDAQGCGQIGALGQGCLVPAGVASPSESLARAFTASPNPSRGAVLFSWPGSVQPERVEVFDVTGSRRWSALITAGTSSLQWRIIDHEGRRLPAGVYYARLLGKGVSVTARFVFVQ